VEALPLLVCGCLHETTDALMDFIRLDADIKVKKRILEIWILHAGHDFLVAGKDIFRFVFGIHTAFCDAEEQDAVVLRDMEYRAVIVSA